MVDLHTHVLPHLDDGARDLAEAVEIVRAMANDGVRIVACTPHVREDYPTTPDQMERGLRDLREAVEAAGIEVELRGGAEISLSLLDPLDMETLASFGLGGNPQLLLLEMPYHGWPLSLTHQCDRLLRAGIVPVLAHPERNGALEANVRDLEQVVRSGAIVQLTAAAVDGRLGQAAARRARLLLQRELAHMISSDAHSPELRESGLSGAARAIGGELGDWLTTTAPGAVLAGAPIPTRPAAPRRARRLLGRRAQGR